MPCPADVIAAADELRNACGALTFAPPVHTVYNPLVYAWERHVDYLTRYAAAPKRVLFLGMNPGPWGMAQVGVPFGEIAAVRDWLGIAGPVDRPPNEHPKRPVEGFACTRSEVSGRRLWGLFALRFGVAALFARDHFVANYCPLMFMEESARNRTPDKLPAAEKADLVAVCDQHLRRMVELLRPEFVVGVGRFAANQAESALSDHDVRVVTVLHPSPASPAANRGWSEAATRQLKALGIWD